MGQREKSDLDYVIPPEILGDAFHSVILNLARQPDVRTALEIGSSSGGGSTDAFVRGMRENPGKPTLFCMQISAPRFEALAARLAGDSFVKCYRASSVPLSAFPSEQQVADFYHSTPTKLNLYPLERVLGWLRADKAYVAGEDVPSDGIAKVKRENGIKEFDMVLIDGSEFSGIAEFKEVYGAKYILLDDVLGYKNHTNYQDLMRDPNYLLREENMQLRNGYAVFERIDNDAPERPGARAAASPASPDAAAAPKSAEPQLLGRTASGAYIISFGTPKG